MVTARAKYDKFLLGPAMLNAATLDYSAATFAELEGLVQGATGVTHANNTDTIFSPLSTTPFYRSVRVSGSTDVNIGWFDLAPYLRSFDIDQSESGVDITSIAHDTKAYLAGIPEWKPTLTLLAGVAIIDELFNASAISFGMLHIERAGSVRKLTAAVQWGGHSLDHEDTGLETVSFPLYNISLDRPQWRT